MDETNTETENQDSDEQEGVEGTETDTTSEGNEEATEPGAVKTEPKDEVAAPLTAAQQAIFDSALGGKVKRAREAEQLAENLRQQLADTQAQIPQPVKPAVPVMPDPYDDQFQEKMQARDAALIAQASFDAQEQIRASQAETQHQNAQQAQRDALNTASNAFSDRGTKIGIDPTALDVAANTIAAGGLAGQVGMHILQLDQGPAITMYLARHPLEVDALARMAPMDAAAKIATEIAAKAKASAVSTKQPPAPVETEKGVGAALERGPKGAVYS